jgi:hypothetical protein
VANDGQDLTLSNLMQILHFGCNISGGNGQAMAAGNGSCQTIALGGQGGGGLYIIAQNVIFTGQIKLNGGSGTAVIGTPCNSGYNCSSAGGGAGSCIISTNNLISQSGTFQANGGNSGTIACGKRGGNGALLIIQN